MDTILSIDQGTTGSKCLVLDHEANVVGRAYSEFTQHFPEPGWVEHDADEIWRVTLDVARTALDAAGVRPGGNRRLAAVGITNQRETIVLWDRKTGRPVHRALVWQDRRTAARCRELDAAGRSDFLRARTGLLADPYFSGTKLEWLLEHVPGARERAEAGDLAAGTIDSWLIWNLSGGRAHVTEPTNASRTLLYNIDRQAWDPELLDLFGVPESVLPEVRPSSGVMAETDPDLFGVSVPVAGVAGDQQAALFGQGCCDPGLAKNTYGTGAFLLLNTGDRRVASERGLLTTVACGPKGEPVYALEGAIFIAGAAVQWLRDGLGIIDKAEETAALAASIDSNEGVYLVPAFVGLGAPHWESEARGTLVGVTRGTTGAHLARAALEAMAYSTAEVLDAMTADSGIEAVDLAVDGGASANDWLMQFQADVVGLPVRRPQMIETTALGAAGLAGLAVGVWPDLDAFMGVRPAPDRFEPRMSGDDRARHVEGWTRAVDAARTWARWGR